LKIFRQTFKEKISKKEGPFSGKFIKNKNFTFKVAFDTGSDYKKVILFEF